MAFIISRHFSEVAEVAGIAEGDAILPPLAWGILLAVALFVSVALHELAHAWVATRAGGLVREITLMIVGGVSRIERMPRGGFPEVLVAAAGPLMSFTIGALLFGLRALTPDRFPDASFGLFYLASTNVVLGIFNLVPALPMDGGRILRGALAVWLGPARATSIAVGIGRVIALAMGMWALWSGNILLFLIALFVFTSAQDELRYESLRELIEGVSVDDVMTVAPPTVPLDASLADALAGLRAARRLEIVVVDPGGAPLGVVSATDIATAPAGARSLADFEAKARAGAIVVPPRTQLSEALARSNEARAKFILVARRDESGEALLGIIGPRELESALALRMASRRMPPLVRRPARV